MIMTKAEVASVAPGPAFVASASEAFAAVKQAVRSAATAGTSYPSEGFSRSFGHPCLRSWVHDYARCGLDLDS